jgi:ribosomal protein L18
VRVALVLNVLCDVQQTLKMRKIRVANVENGKMRLNVFKSNQHIYGQVCRGG